MRKALKEKGRKTKNLSGKFIEKEEKKVRKVSL
jgi:hypothetical protein